MDVHLEINHGFWLLLLQLPFLSYKFQQRCSQCLHLRSISFTQILFVSFILLALIVTKFLPYNLVGEKKKRKESQIKKKKKRIRKQHITQYIYSLSLFSDIVTYLPKCTPLEKIILQVNLDLFFSTYMKLKLTLKS